MRTQHTCRLCCFEQSNIQRGSAVLWGSNTACFTRTRGLQTSVSWLALQDPMLRAQASLKIHAFPARLTSFLLAQGVLACRCQGHALERCPVVPSLPGQSSSQRSTWCAQR